MAAEADSTGRRNTLDYSLFDQPVERLRRRLPAQSFSWLRIQRMRNGVQFFSTMLAEVRSFGKVFAEQSVGVLIVATLPMALGVAEVDLETRCRVALKSGTRRVEQRLLPLIVTFRRQLVGVFPCFAVQSGQLLQVDGALFQTHEARQLLRTHRGQC